VRRLYERDEPYHLRLDRGEQVNRSDDPACAGVAAELRDRLLTRLPETADAVPFATGADG